MSTSTDGKPPDALSTSDAPAAAAGERRRLPRLENLSTVNAELISVRARVNVPEVGLGGFSVETAFPFRPGQVYRFRFTRDLDDEEPVRLRARAVYSRRTPDSDAPYVTGLVFLDDRNRDRDAICRLIDHVTSGISFELAL